MSSLPAFLHIAGWLGLGGGTTIAAIVFGIVRPKYMFVAMLAATLAGTATFIYAKGAHDDFVLQRRREVAAEQSALKQAAEIKQRAQQYAAKAAAAASKPAPRHRRHLFGHGPSVVRDRYSRD